MLDERHQDLLTINGGPNIYTFGSIKGSGSTGVHNVVMVCLPAGSTGACPASAVTTHMISNFKSLRFCLLVGIGGGVPSKPADIRLGDVVVNCPTKDSYSGGMVQFDVGKTVAEGQFHRTGCLNKPSPVLMAAISKLKAYQYSQKLSNFFLSRNSLCEKPQNGRQISIPGLRQRSSVSVKLYPRQKPDNLFLL